jgi:hypothetical protein
VVRAVADFDADIDVGCPFSTPVAIASLMPLSIDVMKRFGITPPIVVSSGDSRYQPRRDHAKGDVRVPSMAARPRGIYRAAFG